MNSTKVCSKCFVEKPIEDFGWKSMARGKRHAVCKACTAIRSSNWYYENREHQIENVRNNRISYRQTNREYILEYLTTHPCSLCGETDPVVLEFHHVRGEKSIEVSRLIGRGASLEILNAELAKCDVVCANCHRRITSKNQGWFKR